MLLNLLEGLYMFIERKLSIYRPYSWPSRVPVSLFSQGFNRIPGATPDGHCPIEPDRHVYVSHNSDRFRVQPSHLVDRPMVRDKRMREGGKPS